MAMLMCLSLAGCDFAKSYPKHIQEFPGPWQVLDPGKPLETFPRVEILKQGAGAKVELGNLVELQLVSVRLPKYVRVDRGAWWIWIGFVPATESAFYGNQPAIASALVGRGVGTSLRFVDVPGIPSVVGREKKEKKGPGTVIS